MAVVKYSALLDELRGKLNGTVFSKFHDGYNSYKKGQPSKWASEAQCKQRQNLSMFAKNWATSGQAYKNEIATRAVANPQPDRFGQLRELTPFHYSILVQQQRYLAGLPPIATFTSSTPSLPSNTIVNSDVTITLLPTGRYQISGSLEIQRLSVSTSDHRINIYVSRSTPSTDTTRRRTHLFFYSASGIPQGPALGTYTISFSDRLLPEYFSPSLGSELEIMLRPFGAATMQMIPPTYHRIPFTFVPPAPPEWPITWAFSGNDGRFTELQNAGGTWQPQGTGTWLASPSENLAGVAADYEFELAMSPNLFSSDIARPEEFDDPRPTLSGTLAAKSSFAPYYITPAAIGDLQAWMRSNFSYTSGDGYKYQPTAIRIKNPTSGAWSNWGYSNIWLPIF